MDRKTYFKRKIFEMTDSQSVMKKSCRRKITFEDEMSDISQEPKKQCLELKLLTDANTSTNQPLVSSEGALSPEIFLNNNLPIANSDVTDKAVIAASEESQAECRQNIITNNSNDENLEETVDISSELQVEDDSNLVLNTNTMTEKNTSSISASNKLSKRSSDRKLIKKTYCEFISDNEDPYFTDEFSSWNEKSGNDSNSDTPITKKSKKKTTKKNKLKLTEELDKETTTNEPLQEIIGKPDDISIVGEKGKKIQQTNTRKERKVCKNSGKEYIQTNGKIRSKKEIKPNPCVGKKCGNNCQVITEERRLSLFNHFWTLSSERQRDWIVNMSRRITIKRKRSKDSGKRNYSFEYYINDNEDRRKVCQQFILNTLDVSQTYMYYTLSNCIEGSSKEDLRGRHIPANKTKEATKQNVQNFIKKLPALPSHYCRRDTTKLYLPVEYKNHKNLYRIYKEEKTSAGIDYVSEKVFLNIFKTEFNIGFHVPKKDKCVKCIKLDAENTEESKAEKEEHLKEKIASKERYKSHRELSQKHSDVICTSFDLQKVLNTPHGESMLLYYSRKYAIYNLCFYENGSREGFCYIWGESEGKRGGNEIASIIQKYINLVDSRASVKHLLLYSDSCPGQNKNKIVLAALHNALKNCENILSIQINYLLPGHTEMSVDSMHSVIEGSVRNTIVWAPSQWATICQLARKDPKPYNVNYLDHTDFLGFDGFADKYFRGNLTGKISKIRVATFKKSKINQMAVKYSMKPDAEEEIIPVIGASNSKIVDRLYTTSLPITKVKYNNLKKLCDDNVIPKLYHREYLTLTSVSGVDTLTETDVEDVL